jgi:hypothetical protein
MMIKRKKDLNPGIKRKDPTQMIEKRKVIDLNQELDPNLKGENLNKSNYIYIYI